MSVKRASILLFVIGVALCALLYVFGNSVQTIRTDLNDLPPEAIAAPRNHSGAVWI